MIITTTCPGCAKAIKVRDELIGKKVRCPVCKQVFSVPGDALASAPGETPPAVLSPAPEQVGKLAPNPNPGPPPVVASPANPPSLPPIPPPKGSQPLLPWLLFAITVALLIGVVSILVLGLVSGRGESDSAKMHALILLLLWAGQLTIVPMIGGFFLWLGCKLTKIHPATYLRCWVAYLGAFVAASCLCIPLLFLMPRAIGVPTTSTLLVSLVLAILVHWTVIPLVLRAGFLKSLLAQTFAILMTASLAVLMAIPVILHLRGKAHDVIDMANIRELADAIQRYEQDLRKLPPHALYANGKKPLLSWRVAILPYLDQTALHRQFRLNEPWDSEHNIKLLPRMPKVFTLSGKESPQTETHFQVFTSAFPPKQFQSAFPKKEPNHIDLNRITSRDGTANTILIAEAAMAVPWTKPDDMEFTFDGPLPGLGAFPGKSYFLAAFCDSSVRRISANIPAEVLRLLIAIDDGEVIPFDKVDPR